MAARLILLEWHIWMGFFAGHHDLFMYRITLGWVSVYVDRVPVSNALRKLRDQLRAARHELTTRTDVPGSVTKKGQE